MNLVEAPDHAGPVAPPHAPERLRTLLAEGRDAQNDETPRVKGQGSNFFSFEIEFRFLLGFEYFCPGVEALEGRKFLPCVFLLSLSLVSAASAEATATEQSEFAEM